MTGKRKTAEIIFLTPQHQQRKDIMIHHEPKRLIQAVIRWYCFSEEQLQRLVAEYRRDRASSNEHVFASTLRTQRILQNATRYRHRRRLVENTPRLAQCVSEICNVSLERASKQIAWYRRNRDAQATDWEGEREYFKRVLNSCYRVRHSQQLCHGT